MWFFLIASHQASRTSFILHPRVLSVIIASSFPSFFDLPPAAFGPHCRLACVPSSRHWHVWKQAFRKKTPYHKVPARRAEQRCYLPCFCLKCKTLHCAACFTDECEHLTQQLLAGLSTTYLRCKRHCSLEKRWPIEELFAQPLLGLHVWTLCQGHGPWSKQWAMAVSWDWAWGHAWLPACFLHPWLQVLESWSRSLSTSWTNWRQGLIRYPNAGGSGAPSLRAGDIDLPKGDFNFVDGSAFFRLLCEQGAALHDLYTFAGP